MTARGSTIARTATVLSRNPLGLLALCLVIGEAIAAMFLLHPAGLAASERLLLCGFVVVYPLCVVAAIYRLISRHHTKLYAPADFRDERCFLEVLRLTDPGQALPLASTRAIAGEDFALLEPEPAANSGRRPEPGVYRHGRDEYYVTWRQQVYLLRRDGQSGPPQEVRALPRGCEPVPRQDWDHELRALADVAEQFARR
ncbi:MAG TPA: hypothetical protein VGB85_03010 [Nannocystis sp.]|jgi:hypothetical protein